MYCRSCGKELPDNTKFCAYCGVPQQDGLVSAQTIAEQQQVQPAPVKRESPIVYFLKGIVMSFLILAVMGAVAFGACALMIIGASGG